MLNGCVERNHNTKYLTIAHSNSITNMDTKQVPLTRSQIKYLMNLMMGDYHSNHSRLYNHLQSYLDDDILALERKAAKLEVTVDELYTRHARRDLDRL